MNRSFLLVVLLFFFPSDHVQAQTGTSKTATPTNTSKHADAKAASGEIETNPEAKSLYDDGVERLEMGQVSEAVERFEKALKLDPEYVAAYSALGRAFFKLRQWENASETLRRAIELKAKKRESQEKLQQNQIRGTERDFAPATPAEKPKGTSSSGIDKVNKPWPALPAVAAVSVVRLGAGLKPPPVSQTERIVRANSKFDDLLGSPPPEVPANEKPVQPPAAATIPQSTLRPTAAAISEAQVAVNVTPLLRPGEAKSVSPTLLAEDIALTTIYRVGPQDVLEIRLNSSQPQQTTVFKVTRLGTLEHPQLNGPLPVTGLTVEEIGARIENALKTHAATENPKALVAVLEYASHSVVVDGLVKNPGTKSLESEAIPLAVFVAEAQPLPEAARVTVLRDGSQILDTDLNHTADTRVLVHPGDVVSFQPEIEEFLYVEGKVKFPGEKRYRFGLTLMQAIIMAGGTTSNASVAEILREDNELARTRFDLKAIQAGKIADPAIKPRDRIVLH